MVRSAAVTDRLLAATAAAFQLRPQTLFSWGLKHFARSYSTGSCLRYQLHFILYLRIFQFGFVYFLFKICVFLFLDLCICVLGLCICVLDLRPQRAHLNRLLPPSSLQTGNSSASSTPIPLWISPFESLKPSTEHKRCCSTISLKPDLIWQLISGALKLWASIAILALNEWDWHWFSLGVPSRVRWWAQDQYVFQVQAYVHTWSDISANICLCKTFNVTSQPAINWRDIWQRAQISISKSAI